MLFVNWTSERDEDNPFQNKFYFVFVNGAVSSSFKRTANNPRWFDKPWQLMTGYGNIAKSQASRLVSEKFVQFDAPPPQKKNI